jgi:hypothetical protein
MAGFSIGFLLGESTLRKKMRKELGKAKRAIDYDVCLTLSDGEGDRR